MKGKRLLLIGLFLSLALLSIGCGGQATASRDETETTDTPVFSHGGAVDDYVSLVDSLRSAGATVEPGDSVEQAIFEPVVGQIIKVNGQDVQVFEFETEESAQTTAETISPDGSSTSTTMITWIATPHFYRAGKVIVLYVGDDSGVLSVLAEVLGEQFAGG